MSELRTLDVFDWPADAARCKHCGEPIVWRRLDAPNAPKPYPFVAVNPNPPVLDTHKEGERTVWTIERKHLHVETCTKRPPRQPKPAPPSNTPLFGGSR